MKRTEIVRLGAEDLVTAEDAVERALCETMTLASNLGRMRMDAKISMVVGQEAMGALSEAITALTTARGAMVRAHGHLDDVKTQIGCRTVAVGTLIDKGSAKTDLQVVASDRPAA
jgi:hypothetical protein